MNSEVVIPREKLDAIISNIAHIRELRAKQDKLYDEMILALCYQHLWPGWSICKRRKAELVRRPGTASIPAPYYWPRKPELAAMYRTRMDAVLIADGEERRFPADTIPDVLWEHMLKVHSTLV